ncbi:NAD(P)H-dependent oxidoreductase [Xanthomonas theicola]|uniref:NAD(P)H-dependent oxidoreductase n=1 Tax=Xanthomonas theicola TaxID=56464 RepID=UPI001FE580D1|nr:NAD(P)H-dependent oxidoreductase [Xanthomonas theicola]
MNVLLVYAHPEPMSLNGALKDFAVQRLQGVGHHVQVSDLYAMQWKSTLDAQDSLDGAGGDRFDPSADSKRAFASGRQRADIAAEQDKLRWADAVLLQFPLWWFSMPAILKGWVDRVYADGFAYGVGEHSDARWGDRYGEGSMAGKRAMLIVTTGGWESHYAPRGINGPIDEVLFPIQHGILTTPVSTCCRHLVVYRAGRMDADRFAQIRDALGQRLDMLWSAAPIAFRNQNGGDYLIPALTLCANVAAGRSGFAVHVMAPGESAAAAQPASRVARAEQRDARIAQRPVRPERREPESQRRPNPARRSASRRGGSRHALPCERRTPWRAAHGDGDGSGIRSMGAGTAL